MATEICTESQSTSFNETKGANSVIEQSQMASKEIHRHFEYIRAMKEKPFYHFKYPIKSTSCKPGIDFFTTHGDNIIVNQTKNIAQGKTNKFQKTTIYGNMTIFPKHNYLKTYKWSMKITQIDVFEGFYIGITQKESRIDQNGFKIYHHDDPKESILFMSCGQTYPPTQSDEDEWQNGHRWKEGDKLDMILTQNPECSLILYINNKLSSVIHITLGKRDLNAKYCLMAVISHKGQGIEIIDYQTSTKPHHDANIKKPKKKTNYQQLLIKYFMWLAFIFYCLCIGLYCLILLIIQLSSSK